MITATLPGDGIPHWLQLLVAVVAIAGFLLGAAAFVFVIWPSIRRADRRADLLERWIDGPDGKKAYEKLIDFLHGKIDGAPQDREGFLREETGKDGVKGEL